MDVINTFAFKEVQNIENWQFLSRKFLEYLMKEEISLHDIISGIISFKSVSIKSPELYSTIITYFRYKNYHVGNLESYSNHARILKLFNSVGTMHGK